jgi:hypothetical protein
MTVADVLAWITTNKDAAPTVVAIASVIVSLVAVVIGPRTPG